ncbi:uncharacterized protein LOC133728977 [Rosa rugosa]|uniref:uncharacterized protein LOC133728977 n=1 Tax=Rosa rugosa TaxID=74645 RepID=UPI002B408BC7|nr:uncharacterized protein LOC133728977 [Rosa rugosa]
MALPKQSGTKRKLHADDEGGSESESDVSESLSDIDDAEIAPYLNNKKETFYKSIIWEAMNRDSAKGKSRKQARKPQKAAPPSKAVKISTEMDDRKRPSSKINYEALKKLNEEDGNHAPDFDEGSHGDMQHSNDKFDGEAQSFRGSYDDELDNEHAYSEDAEGRHGYEDEDTYFPNDGYNEYGCEDEYCFDDF